MTFCRGDTRAALRFSTGKALTQAQLAFARQQFGIHTAALEASGYTVDDKLADLKDPAARFLFASLDKGEQTLADKQPPLVAFVHFRFTVEGELRNVMAGSPIVLVADMFVGRAYQRRGIGKHLCQFLELIARREGMSGMMLGAYETLASTCTSFVLTKLKGWAQDDAWAPEDGGFVVLQKSFVAKEPILCENSSSPTSVLTAPAAPAADIPDVDGLATKLAAPFWEKVPAEKEEAAAEEEAASSDDENEDQMSERLLDELVDMFVQENGREPTDDEVAQWRETLASATTTTRV
jgi:GNAT superfamily N-acetyltransferase